MRRKVKEKLKEMVAYFIGWLWDEFVATEEQKQVLIDLALKDLELYDD
jgi:hypothetical protein